MIDTSKPHKYIDFNDSKVIMYFGKYNFTGSEQTLRDMQELDSPYVFDKTEILSASIVASKFIEKGEKFTLKNITVKRPSLGLSPTKWFSVLGKTAKKDYFDDYYIKI